MICPNGNDEDRNLSSSLAHSLILRFHYQFARGQNVHRRRMSVSIGGQIDARTHPGLRIEGHNYFNYRY